MKEKVKKNLYHWQKELHPSTLIPHLYNETKAPDWEAGQCSICSKYACEIDLELQCYTCNAFWLCNRYSCRQMIQNHCDNCNIVIPNEANLPLICTSTKYELYDEVMINPSESLLWEDWLYARIVDITEVKEKGGVSSYKRFSFSILPDFEFLQDVLQTHRKDHNRQFQNEKWIDMDYKTPSFLLNIRKLDYPIESIRDFLKFHIKWQSNANTIQDILHKLQIQTDFHDIIPTQAVTTGNISVYSWWNQTKQPKFVFSCDSMNRNIFQLAVISKQTAFIESLLRYHIASVRKIIGWIDNKLLHAIHYLILNGDEELLLKVLYFCCGEMRSKDHPLTFRSFYFLLPVFAPTNPAIKSVSAMAKNLKRNTMEYILKQFYKHFDIVEKFAELIEDLQPYPWQRCESVDKNVQRKWSYRYFWPQGLEYDSDQLPLCYLTIQHITVLIRASAARKDDDALEQYYKLFRGFCLTNAYFKSKLFSYRGSILDEMTVVDDTYELIYKKVLPELYFGPLDALLDDEKSQSAPLRSKNESISLIENICKKMLEVYVVKCNHKFKRASFSFYKTFQQKENLIDTLLEDEEVLKCIDNQFPLPKYKRTEKLSIIKAIFPSYLKFCEKHIHSDFPFVKKILQTEEVPPTTAMGLLDLFPVVEYENIGMLFWLHCHDEIMKQSVMGFPFFVKELRSWSNFWKSKPLKTLDLLCLYAVKCNSPIIFEYLLNFEGCSLKSWIGEEFLELCLHHSSAMVLMYAIQLTDVLIPVDRVSYSKLLTKYIGKTSLSCLEVFSTLAVNTKQVDSTSHHRTSLLSDVDYEQLSVKDKYRYEAVLGNTLCSKIYQLITIAKDPKSIPTRLREDIGIQSRYLLFDSVDGKNVFRTFFFFPILVSWKENREVVNKLFVTEEQVANDFAIEFSNALDWFFFKVILDLDIEDVLTEIITFTSQQVSYNLKLSEDVLELLQLWKVYIEKKVVISSKCLGVIDGFLSNGSFFDRSSVSQIETLTSRFLQLCKEGATISLLEENIRLQQDWLHLESNRLLTDLPFIYLNISKALLTEIPCMEGQILFYYLIDHNYDHIIMWLLDKIGMTTQQIFQGIKYCIENHKNLFLIVILLETVCNFCPDNQEKNSIIVQIILLIVNNVKDDTQNVCYEVLKKILSLTGVSTCEQADISYPLQSFIIHQTSQSTQDIKDYRIKKWKAMFERKKNELDSERQEDFIVNVLVELAMIAYANQTDSVWSTVAHVFGLKASDFEFASREILDSLFDQFLSELPSCDKEQSALCILRFKRILVWLSSHTSMRIYSYEDLIMNKFQTWISNDITEAQYLLLRFLFEWFGFSLQRYTLLELTQVGAMNNVLLSKLRDLVELEGCLNRLVAILADEKQFVKELTTNDKFSKAFLLSRKLKDGKSIFKIAIENDLSDILRYLWTQRSSLPSDHQLKTKSEWMTFAKHCGSYRCMQEIKSWADKYFGLNVIKEKFRASLLNKKQQERSKQIKKIACIKIQSWVRRHLVLIRNYFDRNAFRQLQQQFYCCWREVLVKLRLVQSHPNQFQPFKSWMTLKKEIDLSIAKDIDTEDTISGKEKQISSMMADVASYQDHDVEADDEEPLDLSTLASMDLTQPSSQAEAHENYFQKMVKVDRIELSSAVLKWYDKADALYRDLLVRRLNQLAAGERSYALSKRLKHVKYLIFETKLDKGQRILWTKLKRGDEAGLSLLVWFVSKHDQVNHFLKYIVDSFERLANQPKLIADEHLSEKNLEGLFMELEPSQLLLDPLGNVPLKVYATPRDESNLWCKNKDKPRLLLSNHQQNCAKSAESVLLLGRSGTGKTLCLIEAIMEDRIENSLTLQPQVSTTYNQCFVARSKRLCNFVKNYLLQNNSQDGNELSLLQDVTNCNDDTPLAVYTLADFILHMETVVSNVRETEEVSKITFTSAKHVDFNQFRMIIKRLPSNVKKRVSSVGKPSKSKTHSLPKVDAIVLWTQIRSFIKGSVEAILYGRPITLEEYLDLNVFPEERCRLNSEQRKQAYQLYEEYCKYCKDNKLWDDCDRVAAILAKSKLEPLFSSCSSIHHKDYDRIYVDEIQDSTQAEIVLYLLAVGMNTKGLYLAGDPAQAVEEGVNFRFEEVRSIIYKLSNGQQSIHKPLKLHINYRSHTGILQCAAAVLDQLFIHYPGSVKSLPKDEGMFKGPRPVYSYRSISNFSGKTKSTVDILKNLLDRNQRLVTLCPDGIIDIVEKQLKDAGITTLVLGIRESKGLEFNDVIIYNYFSTFLTEEKDRKAWKLLLEENPETNRFQGVDYPHIEGQLKLLYTAITRSCNRLFFVESNREASDLFFEWLKRNDLAEMMKVDALDTESVVLMTNDEWRVYGLELSLSGEESEDYAVKERFFTMAKKCFATANDIPLLEKVELELQIVSHRNKMLSLSSQNVEELKESWTKQDECNLAKIIEKCIDVGSIPTALELCLSVVDITTYEDLYKLLVAKVVHEISKQHAIPC